MLLRRVALHGIGWSAWMVLLIVLDLQSNDASLDDLRPLPYVSLALLGYAVPWYGATALFRRLSGRLAWRLLAVAAAATAWGLALVPISHAFGLPASIIESETAMLFTVAVTLGLRESIRGWQARRRLARIEQLRVEAEQRLLGAQLAPHTLFNLLNTLYAVALSRPSDLAAMVDDLSRMTLPMADERPVDFHPAGDEWRFIESYRRFALARTDPRSRITLAFEGDAGGLVPAWLPATLFENAVKHGIDGHGRLDVEVALTMRPDGLLLRLRNRLPATAAPADGLQAGLDLVRRRLQYLYPYRHRFEAAAAGDAFDVVLETW